jgi:hypothetical protein
MRLARCALRPGGVLLLSVPVGPDVVVYNLHRRYGRLRLPLLLYGWELEHAMGWQAHRLDQPANYRRTYEPVFVLRKPDASTPSTEATETTETTGSSPEHHTEL